MRARAQRPVVGHKHGIELSKGNILRGEIYFRIFARRVFTRLTRQREILDESAARRKPRMG